jgi:DNA-binding response OmpR family regulator
MDADPQSARVLEVSLRKAGYKVTSATRIAQASAVLAVGLPDLVLLDPGLEGEAGLAWLATLRQADATRSLPVMVICGEGAAELRTRALALGVDDYVQKPLYVREVLARVDLVLSRHERESLRDELRSQMSGSLADLGFVDLLQTIDVSQKTGVLQVRSQGRTGAVYFRDGRVVDAQYGPHEGESALYRFLSWSSGEFELVFRPVRQDDRLGVSTPGLLMECMRRLDAWGALLDELPPLGNVLDVDRAELARRISEVRDEDNALLASFDGGRSMEEVIDAAPGDDLAALARVGRLVRDGFLVARAPLSDRPPADAVPVASAAANRPEPAVHGLGAPPHGAPVTHTLRPAGMFAAPTAPSPTGGGVRIGGVQLRRVPSSAMGTLGDRSPQPDGAQRPAQKPAIERSAREPVKKPERGDDVQGVRGESRAQEEADAPMSKQSKRKAPGSHAVPDGASSGETATVIPLKVARQEPVERNEPSVIVASAKLPPARELSPAAGLHDDDEPEVGAFFADNERRGSWADARKHELPLEPLEPADHQPEPDELHRHPAGKRSALAIAILGGLAIGGFLVYHKVIMPPPAELADRPVALPTPDMLRDAPPIVIAAPPPQAEALAPAAAAPDSPVAEPVALAAEPAAAEPAAQDPAGPSMAEAPVARDPAYGLLLERAQALGFKKGAETAYLQALALEPEGAEALSGLAMLYLNQGKTRDARQRALEALAQAPDDSGALIVLGATYSAEGDASKAREAYAKCAGVPGKYAAECKRMLR